MAVVGAGRMGSVHVGALRRAAATSPGRPGGDPDNATILASMSAGGAVVVSLGRRFPHEDSCWLEVWDSDGDERVEYMWNGDGQRALGDAIVRRRRRSRARTGTRRFGERLPAH
jgi:hypothetical protein